MRYLAITAIVLLLLTAGMSVLVSTTRRHQHKEPSVNAEFEEVWYQLNTHTH